MKISKQLFDANEKDIFNLTGCLSSCEKFEYNIQSSGDINYFNSGFDVGWLQLYFKKAEHEFREQVKLDY